MTSAVRAPETGHPIVIELFDALQADDVTVKEIARRAGVSAATIRSWRTSYTPQLQSVTAVANALGFDLVLVPRSTATPYPAGVDSPPAGNAPGREPPVSGRAAFSGAAE